MKIVRIFSPLVALLSFACTPNPPVTTPPLSVSRLNGGSEIQVAAGSWTSLVSNQAVHSGSRFRTASNSFVDLSAQSSPHRVVLAANSEATIERWQSKASAGAEEVRIALPQGSLLVDLAPITAASSFEIKGSNFLASVRSMGPTVAAVTANGFVLVQTGTIVCVVVSPPSRPTAVTINASQMLDPAALIPKPIPASSNHTWNLLSHP